MIKAYRNCAEIGKREIRDMSCKIIILVKDVDRLAPYNTTNSCRFFHSIINCYIDLQVLFYGTLRHCLAKVKKLHGTTSTNSCRSIIMECYFEIHLNVFCSVERQLPLMIEEK